MFEQIFSHLLRQFLGDFVEGGSILHEKVQLGVWSGYIVLEQLVLKKNIFDKLNIPLSLSHGIIGRLEFRIPWGNLGADPIIIVIDRVLLLLEPKYEWNPDGRDMREQTLKQAKLSAAELFANQRKLGEDMTSSASSPEPTLDPFQSYVNLAKKWLMKSIVNNLIENIQITIRDIHIRYEDRASCPTDFCVGVSFESLHVQSRDMSIVVSEMTQEIENQNGIGLDEVFDEQDSIHKLLQINHLIFYWNPLVATTTSDACSSAFTSKSPADIELLMLRTIVKRNHQFADRPKHHYILLPLDVEVQLALYINSINGTVKTKTNIFIPKIALCVEDRQCREIISLSTNMSNFLQIDEYSGFRPKDGIMENPRAWWR